VGQGPPEGDHVADGEVEALGAGGRHGMCGVTGEEEAAVPHGFGDVEAVSRDHDRSVMTP
jgi:hypothetical protein